MPLTHLLYECPYCGHDPLEVRGLGACCPRCGRRFEPGAGGTRITVIEAGGDGAEVPASLLARGARELDTDSGRGRVERRLEQPASMRVASAEAPLRARGGLLGYVEQLGPSVSGTLVLSEEGFGFREKGGRAHEWPLRDIRALQGSASSIQISPAGGGVVTFKLADDSPRRWEEQLKALLRGLWRDEGLGEIAEFQPRIRGW